MAIAANYTQPDFNFHQSLERTTTEEMAFSAVNFTTEGYLDDIKNQKSFRYLGIVIGLVDVFFGTLGNSLTILAFFKNRKLRRNIFNLFIVNLSFVDLLTASAMMPFNIAGYVNMGWPFGNDHITCILQAFFYFSCGYTSVVCLLAITMNRFIGIVFPDRYITIYSSKWATVILFLSWIIAPSFVLPVMASSLISSYQDASNTILGWKRKEFLCTFVHMPDWSKPYMQVLRVIFQFLPLVLMVVAYLIMVRRVHASNQRIRKNSHIKTYQERLKPSRIGENSIVSKNCEVISEPHEQQRGENMEMTKFRPKKVITVQLDGGSEFCVENTTQGCLKRLLGICKKKNEKKITIKRGHSERSNKSLLNTGDQQRRHKEMRLMYLSVVICSTFTILFLPSLIVNLLPWRSHLDSRLHMAASNITWLNSCVNPFIYVALHRRMRKEYKKILVNFYNSIVSPQQDR